MQFQYSQYLLRFKKQMSTPRIVVSQCFENSPISLLTSLQDQSSAKISPKLLFPSSNSQKQNSQNTNVNTNTPPHERTLSNFTISESPERRNGYEYAMNQMEELRKNVDRISEIGARYRQIYPDSSILLGDDEEMDQDLLIELRQNLFQILEQAQMEQRQAYRRMQVQSSIQYKK